MYFGECVKQGKPFKQLRFFFKIPFLFIKFHICLMCIFRAMSDTNIVDVCAAKKVSLFQI